jgi:hypothetical protein
MRAVAVAVKILHRRNALPDFRRKDEVEQLSRLIFLKRVILGWILLSSFFMKNKQALVID